MNLNLDSTTTTTESVCRCMDPSAKGNYCNYILELLDLRGTERKTTSERKTTLGGWFCKKEHTVQHKDTTTTPMVVQPVLATMPVQQSITTRTPEVVAPVLATKPVHSITTPTSIKVGVVFPATNTRRGIATNIDGCEKAVVTNVTAKGANIKTERQTNTEEATTLESGHLERREGEDDLMVSRDTTSGTTKNTDVGKDTTGRGKK